MSTLTLHILDAFTQDLHILAETETTQEARFVPDDQSDGEDGEVRRRPIRRQGGTAAPTIQKRKLIIHLFGTTGDGTPLRVDVEGFEPFFYVKLPVRLRETQTAFQERLKHTIQQKNEWVLKGPDAYTVTFEKRKVLMGYTASREFTFAKISVQGMQAWRSMKSIFLDKENGPIFYLYNDGRPPLEVFEANLDPMLRFFHLRNLKPCGWATITEVEEPDDFGVYHVDWESVSPTTNPSMPCAPFLHAYWDIECYSENGEFPVPKKGYDRVAKLLSGTARDGAHAVELLLQAAVYPDNPPTGMEAIRFRVGAISRDTLEALLNEKRFTDAMEDAITPVNRSPEAILAVLDKHLKRRLVLAGDPIIQIGVVLERGQSKMEKHIFVLDTCERIAGVKVHTYKTEKDLILGWARAMREWNPDVLLGYNNFGFDERYVWSRVEELDICKDDALQAMTRLQNTGKELVLQEKFLSSSALGDNTMYMLTTHGRLGVDLYQYIKRSFTLSSYKLDDVCQHFMSGDLASVDCGSEVWNLNTKTTSDVVAGRWIVLLDETGDCVVDKLCVKEIVKGSMIVVVAPEDSELSIAALSAVKWAVVKDDVSPQEIFRFHRGSAADRAKVAAYCIQDCILVRDLYKKLDVFNNAMAMANACSVPIPYIFTRGQGIKIESLIFKECYERGQCVKVLPTTAFGAAPSTAGAAPDESYEGAIVLEPKPGIYYDSPIGVADFASLYPSTIISENISYDTLVWVKDYNLDGSFRKFSLGSDEDEAIAGPDVRWTDITFDIWGADPEDKRKHPTKIKQGLRVCRYAQGGAGTLPQIVQKLLATRKAKRKEAEKEGDPFKKALLDAEQLAYKLTANSLYGQLGSPTFKIRLQHLAASVTAYGRKQILFAKAAIEQFYGAAAKDPRCSAETVYGDTDSLFINFNVKDAATGVKLEGKAAIEATMRLTEEAGKFVTRALKAPHDFEYDKVFYPFIIFSKKRYVGNKYEGSVDSYYQNSMGIATKRRDYAPIVKLIYGGALRILLTDKDILAAITFVKEKLGDLVDGKMSMNLLTMSKSLRAEYKAATPPAHKMLADRMKLRDEGTAPASGERVPFIYILPPTGQVASKLQGERVEHPTYIRANGLKPDFRFYIEHQLMNPIVQLFSLVAEQIPGVRVPAGGWKEGDRESATTEAIFQESLTACDRSAVRRFGAQFFGTAAATAAAVEPKAEFIRLPVRKITVQTPIKTQSKLNTYFADKMLLKKIESTKMKKEKI